MIAVRRGLLLSLLCLVVLTTGSARAERPAAGGELVEIVVGLSQKPLGTTRWAAGRQLQSRTMVSSQAALAQPDRADDPGSADPLALPARRERDGCRRAALPARAAQLAPGRRQGLSERPLPHPARPQPAADRRAGALGPGPDERRPGDEDRDHRRGDRPDAPVLLARRLHDAAGLPEGSDRVHDREGDRRARVPARPPDLEEREPSRSIRSSPHTARTSPGSRPATRTRSPRASASPGSRRAPTWGTTRR